MSGVGLQAKKDKSQKQEEQLEEEPAPRQYPLAVVDGNPFIMVSILDPTSDFDMTRAPLRERMLKAAFAEALKESGMRYAYSLAFSQRKRPDYVPELVIDIREWKYVATGAFECQADAFFTDAMGERHDLKGAYGVKETMSLSGGQAETEEYMQESAQRAFERLLKRILKNRLYIDQ